MKAMSLGLKQAKKAEHKQQVIHLKKKIVSSCIKEKKNKQLITTNTRLNKYNKIHHIY